MCIVVGLNKNIHRLCKPQESAIFKTKFSLTNITFRYLLVIFPVGDGLLHFAKPIPGF